jgi:general L-amino acid transport system permease protein
MSDAATTTDAALAYVRRTPVEPLPPPLPTSGVAAWLRDNLFSSAFNACLTVIIVLLAVWAIPPAIKFLLIDAVWDGASRADCLATPDRPEVGACWAFVFERIGFFTYGFYPIEERWRVNIFFALLAVGVAWMLWLNAPRRDLGAGYFFVVMPILSFILLIGFPAIGLPYVSTAQWGGVLVTIVVATVGIVFALPLGVLLALGRRSHMPVVRMASVMFIEFVRGVPLITVLFMASVMLPLFVPEAWSPDKLMRALAGVALFSAAYMAEVVRAGLQAIPKGQFEAAAAVGLSYWRTMRLIILPQALKITIPNIVSLNIGLFKDTTLVFVVGIFDLLKTIEAARIDPVWATPVTSPTGYAFAAIFYFIFCFGMSRYAHFVERRLAAGERR